MTDKLLCPFCQREMVIPKEEVRKGMQCCVCRNPKCEFDGWHFPVKLVQELITTRKALDLAVDALKELYQATHYDKNNYVGKVCSNALEQIESITKGGDNE